MKTKQFTTEQIIGVLKEADRGMPAVKELLYGNKVHLDAVSFEQCLKIVGPLARMSCIHKYLAEQLSFKEEITPGGNYERRNEGHQAQIISPGIGRSVGQRFCCMSSTRRVTNPVLRLQTAVPDSWHGRPAKPTAYRQASPEYHPT